MEQCRCGHTYKVGMTHPCHAKMFQCGKPAQKRYYKLNGLKAFNDQGTMPLRDTWACDACWEEYKNQVAVGVTVIQDYKVSLSSMDD